MALINSPRWPSDWEPSFIEGEFLRLDGTPVEGTIRLEAEITDQQILLAGQRKTILATPIELFLNGDGVLPLTTIPATDDPDTNPTGFTYKVTQNFPGGISFSIEAPRGVTQHLTLAQPVPSAVGTPIVRGPEGPSAYDVAVANGFVGTEANWLDSLVGPAGPAGTGEGGTGTAGPSAYDVAVSNGFVGTESAWLASLVGPEGDAGTPGTDGAAGPAGADGAAGPAGISAYQSALAAGFVGTEAAWVASLKGAKGDTGLQGPQGIQGIQGVKGDTGLQGIQGVKGDTGLQGIQGLKGDTGLTGPQGPAGTGALGLSATAPVPANTPVGTMIFRTET